jgi:hypothetical protein
MKHREQTKPNALDEDQSEEQQGEDYDEDHDVLQSNVKFASLKEQALFYGDIHDDDPIDYHDVDVGQETQRNWRTLSRVFSRALGKQIFLGMVYRVCDSW